MLALLLSLSRAHVWRAQARGEPYALALPAQCPSKNQEQIHSVLGIPMHKVTVRTKRLGGGFGGKESRAAFVNAAIAVPAWHLRRPVRVVLDRDEDMQIMGQRHAFVGDYKVRLQQFDLLLVHLCSSSVLGQ